MDGPLCSWCLCVAYMLAYTLGIYLIQINVSAGINRNVAAYKPHTISRNICCTYKYFGLLDRCTRGCLTTGAKCMEEMMVYHCSVEAGEYVECEDASSTDDVMGLECSLAVFLHDLIVETMSLHSSNGQWPRCIKYTHFVCRKPFLSSDKFPEWPLDWFTTLTLSICLGEQFYFTWWENMVRYFQCLLICHWLF